MHDDCERTSNLKMVVQLNPRLGMFSQCGVQISLHLSKQKCFWKTEKRLGINLPGWKDVDAEPKTATKYGKAVGGRFYFWPIWILWPPMYLARRRGTILKFKQKSVRLSGSFSHRFTWTGNHNHTPVISDGATESGKSVVTDRGGAFRRFLNFGFGVSAWITALYIIWWCVHRGSLLPKDSLKAKTSCNGRGMKLLKIAYTRHKFEHFNIQICQTSYISTPQRCSDYIL